MNVCILTSMRVNIFIRKEDEHLWKAINDKPSWLHEKLNESNGGVYTHTKKDKAEIKKALPKNDMLCEHGREKGECPNIFCPFNKD